MTVIALSQTSMLAQVVCYNIIFLHSTALFYWDRSQWEGIRKQRTWAIAFSLCQTFGCLWLLYLYKSSLVLCCWCFLSNITNSLWHPVCLLPLLHSLHLVFFHLGIQLVLLQSELHTCATNLPVSMSGWGWLPTGNFASTASCRPDSISRFLSSFWTFPAYSNFLSESNCWHPGLQSSQCIFDWLILLLIRYFFKWNSFTQVFWGNSASSSYCVLVSLFL